MKFDNYKEKLTEIFWSEVPCAKDAFEEYKRDKEEINEDEEFYSFSRREERQDF